MLFSESRDRNLVRKTAEDLMGLEEMSKRRCETKRNWSRFVNFFFRRWRQKLREDDGRKSYWLGERRLGRLKGMGCRGRSRRWDGLSRKWKQELRQDDGRQEACSLGKRLDVMRWKGSMKSHPESGWD